MQSKNFLIMLAVFITAIIFITSCSSGDDDFGEEETQEITIVQIGAVMNLTEGSTETGLDSQITLLEAEDQINTSLESRGENFRIELIIEDSRGEDELAIEKVALLRSQGIQMIVGPYRSSEAAAIIEEINDVILISPTSTAINLAFPDNLYRLAPNDKFQGKLAAQTAKNAGTIACVTLNRDDNYGLELANAFIESCKEEALITLEGISFTEGETDFSIFIPELESQISDFLATQTDPNAFVTIFLITIGETTVEIFNQIDTNSVLNQAYWLGSDALTGSNLIIEDNKALTFADQVNLTAFAQDEDISGFPSYVELIVEQIEELLGKPPVPQVLASWDALWLATETYRSTGPITDFDNLSTEILIVSQLMLGATGFLALDDNGERIDVRYALFEVIDNAWVNIGSESVTDE